MDLWLHKIWKNTLKIYFGKFWFQAENTLFQLCPNIFLNIVIFLIALPNKLTMNMMNGVHIIKFCIVMFTSIAVGSPCIRSRLQRPLDSYQVLIKYKYKYKYMQRKAKIQKYVCSVEDM